MGKAAVQQDLFMQWYPVAVTLNSANSTTLASNEFNTGLSIRGRYAWLIHRVEMEFDKLYLGGGADNRIDLALSTVRELAAMPDLDDKGTIVKIVQNYGLTTNGLLQQVHPWVWECLPPTIIAAPVLTFYANTAVDFSDYQGEKIIGRIGYTTVPIDQKTYLEIAETFETL